MWAVIKFDRKNLNYLKNQLSLKMGKNCKIYCPKMLVEKFKNNKLIKKEFHLMGDYLFCFNEKFNDKNILEILKSTRGLKYILNGFNKSQSEICKFIDKCKMSEDENGYISEQFYDLKINLNYKFLSGPFANSIFQIIQLQKNKIKILMGNLKTTVNKKEYSFQPV